MTHTPPLPSAAESPFPLHPEPIDPATPAKDPPKGTPIATAKPDSLSTGTMLGVGAAVGIGSAAIVAALMFTRRNGRK
jgi:hypothetical protein